MEGTQAWEVNEELQLVEKTQNFMESSCGGDPTVEQGKSVKSRSHEDKAAAEIWCDDQSSFPVSLHCCKEESRAQKGKI